MDIGRRRATARAEIPGAWLDEVAEADQATATWRLRVRMDDRPGTLARVAIRLADLECNILGLAVLPIPGAVLDEIVIRPAVGLTRAHLVRAIEDEDCECLGITDADVRELVDSSAASLAAAGRVVAAPDTCADAVREILAADMVTVVPAAEANPGRTEGGHRAVFAVPDGMALVARRLWAPFLRQELARVEALLHLLGTVRANVSGPAAVTCTDGAAVVLREGTPGDTEALAALHERCSAETLVRRYRAGARDLPRRQVRRLLAPPHGSSVVAVCGRELVALGQLIENPDEATARFSLLVEDAWQRNGLGTALLQRLAALATGRGHEELVVSALLPEQEAVRRTALRAGLTLAGVDDEGFLHVRL
ncbi:GNAT family N-acetyltransferase [Prauserella oleivorans]|uniref:GNAT family N-acetyltransferase n=1 Tax=Prauserella oleivorans TaxID=1478153 RepID=A0ABW5WFL6_9PSEU